MVDLTERVRRTCAGVMGNAVLVHIDHDRLASYEVPSAQLSDDVNPCWDATRDEAASLLILALDAINFGSGYHDVVRKQPGRSGAVSMASRLTGYVESTGPLTTARLQAITPPDASQIFEQELDGDALEELMTLFAKALNDLGRFLDDGHKGSALQCIAAADGSAVRLAESLTTMAFYRDIERHLGQEVAFYKRAQITPADLARAGHQFNDLHRLTAFADNLVPHVLRLDGLLRYDPSLADQIEAGHRLVPGSQAEVEIRAAGVHVVELLAARTGNRPMDLDLALWQRGGQPAYKQVRRHRSRSVFY